jgi:hypothetical protein
MRTALLRAATVLHQVAGVKKQARRSTGVSLILF